MMQSERYGQKIEERVSKLERQCRRWRMASIALLTVVGGLTLMAADRNARPHPIDASALRIWDDAGRLRAVLASSQSHNTALALIDEQGKVCATLGCGKDGSPGLEMSSHNGKVRLRLEAREDGEPVLQFIDASGKLLSALPRIDANPLRQTTNLRNAATAAADSE